MSALRWHLLVDGQPACSSRELLEDRRLSLGCGGCSSFAKERMLATAAEIQTLYPGRKVEVAQNGCHDGAF